MAQKKNYLWIGIAVAVVAFFAIIFTLNSNNQQEEVTCNSPYIKVGSSCCLDQNYNNICDSDEKELIDFNKIEMTAPEIYKIDLYFEDIGGKSSETKYITLKNNNDAKLFLKIGSSSPRSWTWLSDESGCRSIFVHPEYENTLYGIEPSQLKSFDIQFAIGGDCYSTGNGEDISPTYTKNIEVRTTLKVLAGSDEKINNLLAEIPVEITLHCINAQTEIDDCSLIDL